MTPAQLLARLKRQELAPAYLLLGTEAYELRRLREALTRATLGETSREEGITRYDLQENALAEVIDDARALSLFAARRLILVSHAEAALPRGRAAEDEEGEEGPSTPASADLLAAYLRDPSPDVVLVFEATRYDFEGEDKKKLDRVRKFYAAITEAVELKRPSVDEARSEAQAMVRRASLAIDPAALELLVEALGGDLQRIAVEIEKMTLFAQGTRSVTVDDIAALVPDARTSTIFALVAALGRRDRVRSLEILDTLTREGEYLPLALAFLSTQFRMALVAKEAGLRSPQQVQGHFSRMGVAMWQSRAEQVYQTVARFSKEQLERAVLSTFEADRGLRDARPDDRIVMEKFILRVTA
ncbi:MAG TPA: DNA polymerase III subunit delta [Bryobacteraceae bacterium]|nr:DNA polymerase III subunit delta [Bryobacteraceae bacterium]